MTTTDAAQPPAPPEAGEAELSDGELRRVVERASGVMASLVDRVIGSGRLLDREFIVDLARFVESAMPAVRAYEQLVARMRDAALAETAAAVSGGRR